MADPSPNSTTLTAFVLPVSGGGFPTQLGLMEEWLSVQDSMNSHPNLIFSASGGNVAAYVGLGGQFEGPSIRRVASLLESEIFVRSWWPDRLSFIPSPLAALFTGSLYRPGYGASEFFRSLFTPASIQTTEIWTATFNRTTGRAQLFCNRSSLQALIGSTHFNRNRSFYTAETLAYLNGDTNLIARISAASASIPILVEEQEVFDNFYADGGTMYASSLIPLSHEVYALLTAQRSVYKNARPSNGEPRLKITVEGEVVEGTPWLRNTVSNYSQLRLVYFSSYDMESYTSLSRGGGEVGVVTSALIHANTINDRNAAVNLITQLAGSQSVNHETSTHLTTERLRELVHRLDTEAQHYLIYMYPTGAPQLVITDFVGVDVLRTMDLARSNYHAHLWWIPRLRTSI